MGFIRITSFVAVVAALLCSHLKAAEPAECRWTEDRITIDGVADEACWAKAQVIDNFQMYWKKEGERKPLRATKARLLWDREYIYFFAEMEDGDLFADVTKHNGKTWDNDVFELFFKPADDKPGYYEFQVNAANTRMEMFLPARGAGGYDRFKGATPIEMKSAVDLRGGTLNVRTDRDHGWTVEGRIRWRDLAPTG